MPVPKLGEMYSVASCMQPCQTSAFLQLSVHYTILQLIILLTLGLTRGLEVNQAPILVIIVPFYVQ